jgi:hypothetical protein
MLLQLFKLKIERGLRYLSIIDIKLLTLRKSK